jgi:hypothetical protein
MALKLLQTLTVKPLSIAVAAMVAIRESDRPKTESPMHRFRKLNRVKSLKICSATTLNG